MSSHNPSITPSAERRREPRYLSHRPVSITLPDGSRVQASTGDLSASGLSLQSPHSFPAGVHLTLQIALDSSGHSITLSGQIQHCVGAFANHGFKLGLRHHNPPLPYLGLLRSVRQACCRPHH